MSDLDLVCSVCNSAILRTTSYQCPKCHKPRQVLEAKIARLESRGIEDMKDRIKTLEAAITLADCQYMGCGGNLKPSEIVEAMRSILSEALKATP